jgi:hypothetical protein
VAEIERLMSDAGLFPLEVALVSMLREGPNTEAMVWRRRQAA